MHILMVLDFVGYLSAPPRCLCTEEPYYSNQNFACYGSFINKRQLLLLCSALKNGQEVEVGRWRLDIQN